METSIGIDWISVTSKNKDTACMPAVLLDDEWRSKGKGLLGYDIRMQHISSGVLQLLSSKRDDMGVHVIYSGKSLYKVEKLTGLTGLFLIDYHKRKGHEFSRIDIKIDVYESGLSIDALASDIEKGRAVTRSRSASYVKTLGKEGKTLYVGSMKKRKKLLRIYDKSSELGEKPHRDFIRIELEVKKPTVQEMALGIVEHGYSHIKSVIKGYCDFVNNEVWNEIMSDVSGVMYVDLNKASDTENWLVNTVAPSLAKELYINRNGFRARFESIVAAHYKSIMESVL